MRMIHSEAQEWFSLLLSASSYLEWGTGGSTIMAAWRAVQALLRDRLVTLQEGAGHIIVALMLTTQARHCVEVHHGRAARDWGRGVVGGEIESAPV